MAHSSEAHAGEVIPIRGWNQPPRVRTKAVPFGTNEVYSISRGLEDDLQTTVRFPATAAQPWYCPCEPDLRQVVSDLRSEIADLKAAVATIQGALNERPVSSESSQLTALVELKLLKPIPITVAEYPEDEWVVTWPEANLYGSGDTQEAALAMFRREVESLFLDRRNGRIPDDHLLATVLAAYIEA